MNCSNGTRFGEAADPDEAGGRILATVALCVAETTAITRQTGRVVKDFAGADVLVSLAHCAKTGRVWLGDHVLGAADGPAS